MGSALLAYNAVSGNLPIQVLRQVKMRARNAHILEHEHVTAIIYRTVETA